MSGDGLCMSGDCLHISQEMATYVRKRLTYKSGDGLHISQEMAYRRWLTYKSGDGLHVSKEMACM